MKGNTPIQRLLWGQDRATRVARQTLVSIAKPALDLKNFVEFMVPMEERWRFCERRKSGVPVRSDLHPRIDIESDAFKTWFGDSVLVDSDGRPKTFWHGSFRNFTTFDESEELHPAQRQGTTGFYFTSMFNYACAYGYNLYKVALRAERVFTTTDYTEMEHISLADKAQFIKGGYDAIVFNRAEHGIHAREVVVFSPDQIALISRKHIGGLEPDPVAMHPHNSGRQA